MNILFVLWLYYWTNLPIQSTNAFIVISTKSISTHQNHVDFSSNGRRHHTLDPLFAQKRKRPAVETWRVFDVHVHPNDLHSDTTPGQVTTAVMDALTKRIKCQPSDVTAVEVVRRSLDARRRSTDPLYNYVLDVTTANIRLRTQPGRLERRLADTDCVSTTNPINVTQQQKCVVIVGAGPAGLFCALELLQYQPQVKIVLVERGKPVEQRGRDIGSIVHRRVMNSNSNFCFGEGGAGTWSDGKLTTRIGRNSHHVRQVLNTLVHYGAPAQILVEGAPHLGTDNLVRLLRNMRLDLESNGAQIMFDTRMTRLLTTDGRVSGIEIVTNNTTLTTLEADAVVLATGHSARDVYESLVAQNVPLEPKGFAVGFRIEHPQSLINQIQYGNDWASHVVTRKKRTNDLNLQRCDSPEIDDHQGRLPVASYRLATSQAWDGNTQHRGVYSFCMCPGGQIVPASTDPNEVCVNGMSFSQRDSIWANSALVVTVDPNDAILESYRVEVGDTLAGMAFQKDMERKAAIMGGGNLTVPVQRVTDFIEGRVSSSLPSSSYRLGVHSAPLHELYPAPITHALREALKLFDSQMPGYLSHEALLHGVETRTSSPLRISRDSETLASISGLFPAGEGAGFAGGIVSAAVDGARVGRATLNHLFGITMTSSSTETSSKSVGFNY